MPVFDAKAIVQFVGKPKSENFVRASFRSWIICFTNVMKAISSLIIIKSRHALEDKTKRKRIGTSELVNFHVKNTFIANIGMKQYLTSNQDKG